MELLSSPASLIFTSRFSSRWYNNEPSASTPNPASDTCSLLWCYPPSTLEDAGWLLKRHLWRLLRGLTVCCVYNVRVMLRAGSFPDHTRKSSGPRVGALSSLAWLWVRGINGEGKRERSGRGRRSREQVEMAPERGLMSGYRGTCWHANCAGIEQLKPQYLTPFPAPYNFASQLYDHALR